MLSAQSNNHKKVFLDTAWDIGCELMKDAIWHHETCNWQGYWIEPVNGSFQPVLRTFGADVYSGTSGIALFLNALYEETNDPLLLHTLLGTMSHVRSGIQEAPAYGFYSGKAGIAVALIRTGANLQREEWVREGLSLLESIPVRDIHPHETDVISGVAGTIPVLLDAFEKYQQSSLLDKAVALGDLLCSKAVKQGDVWSWATVPSARNLTGFSHGASGMALALLQLHQATGEKKYEAGAKAGFAYETSTFDKAQQNWPDFREGVGNACGIAWCHGAPGIAISRMKANRLSTEKSNDLHIALSTTVSNLYHNLSHDMAHTNFSLCHGMAGNADIILEGGQQEHRLLAEAVGMAGRKYLDHGVALPSGLNTAQQTPGLMMGTAGMGYFFLRLLDPEKHPTLLLPQLS